MSVYVDNMRAKFGRMILCHMIADTSEELHQMANRIGLKRQWCQHEGTPKEHYDVSLTRRSIAVQLGAIEVSRRQLVTKLRDRK